MKYALLIALSAVIFAAAAATVNATPLFMTSKTARRSNADLGNLPYPPPGRIPFPRYMQTNPKWANDKMGMPQYSNYNITIADQGCAMTSASMMLAGLGVELEGKLVNPGSLNTWLRSNNGYDLIGGDPANLNMSALMELTSRVKYIGETPRQATPYAQIVHDIKTDSVVHLLHVRHQSHFVLAVGAGPTVNGEPSFLVHDPNFNTTIYKYSEVHDIIRYHTNRYRRYMQCGESWSSEPLYPQGKITVCDAGCLMSSISSAIEGTGIKIPLRSPTGAGLNNVTSTPGTLNEWMHQNNGYTPGSDLEESKIPLIAPGRISWNPCTSSSPSCGMHLKNDLSTSQIESLLNQSPPKIIIINVLKGHHFVLVVGVQGDNLYVNDSGFQRGFNIYSHSKDVVGYRLFDMH